MDYFHGKTATVCDACFRRRHGYGLEWCTACGALTYTRIVAADRVRSGSADYVPAIARRLP